jgi:hypothetical protein
LKRGQTQPEKLKAAVGYLLEVARNNNGRHRIQPKAEALRQHKAEILEAHQRGLSVHRIATVFRERGVDISKVHMMRTIRRIIDEQKPDSTSSDTA